MKQIPNPIQFDLDPTDTTAVTNGDYPMSGAWQLIGVFYAENVRERSCGTDEYGRTKFEMVVEAQPRLVWRLVAHENIQALTKALNEAELRLDDVQKQLREREQAAKQCDTRMAALQAELDRQIASTRSERERAAKLTSQLVKMEDDLAKVRAHIGSKVFEEALS